MRNTVEVTQGFQCYCQERSRSRSCTHRQAWSITHAGEHISSRDCWQVLYLRDSWQISLPFMICGICASERETRRREYGSQRALARGTLAISLRVKACPRTAGLGVPRTTGMPSPAENADGLGSHAWELYENTPYLIL